MFDIGSPELLLVAIVAIIIIGPKDLPKAMRIVGYWVGKARSTMNQFRSGFDAMVREAELSEMEKRWAKENERIMGEHPGDDVDGANVDGEVGRVLPAPEAEKDGEEKGEEGETAPGPPPDEAPVMVEKPVVASEPELPLADEQPVAEKPVEKKGAGGKPASKARAKKKPAEAKPST